MVRRFPSSSALLLAFAFAVAVPARAADVIWIYPPPNSLVTESPVNLFGYVAGASVESLEAKIMGAEGTSAPARESLYVFKGRVFSGSVALEPGRNNVMVGDAVLPLLYRPGSTAAAEGDFRRPNPHGDKIDSCNPCHTFTGGKLGLKQALPGLCLSCHKPGTESLRAATQRNEHTQKITPDCLRCHEPHASFVAGLLRSADVCTACHPKRKGYEHGGSGSKACGACHDAHSSGYPKLLRGEAAGLCAVCHKAVLQPPKFPTSFHEPVQQGKCSLCHDVHPTGRPALLKEGIPDLCRGCHNFAEEGSHRGELDECRQCHEPHGSSRRRLLTDTGAEACQRCHEPFPEGKSRHPALQKGGCTACHNPHKVGTFGESRRVCGRCHELNDKGFLASHGGLVMNETRQCSFCHDPHTSKYLRLLRGEVHYPLGKGSCSSCHEQKGDKVELRYEGSQNCLRCHGQMTGTSAIIETDKVHKPVTQIDCTACHNPHMGVRSKFLLEEPVTLCGWCHGILLRGVSNIHGVFNEGGTCYTCHVPHISDEKPLLKQPEHDLCVKCHQKVIPEEVSAKRLLHTPVLRGRCTDCHNPHGTNTDRLLSGTRDRLCADCHKKVLESPEGKPFKYLHGPVGTGNCTACHVFNHRHQTQADRFLRARGSAVCLLCHDTAPEHVRDNYRGKMSEVQNDCLACHTPHGGDSPILLKR